MMCAKWTKDTEHILPNMATLNLLNHDQSKKKKEGD